MDLRKKALPWAGGLSGCLMSKRNRWDKCNRNSGKVIREIRRSAREQNLGLQERQTGSHWIGKVPKRGSIVVPTHGELPRGTWSSIMRMLTAIGIAIFVLFSCYLTYAVLLGA